MANITQIAKEPCGGKQ